MHMTVKEAWDILTQIAYKCDNDEYAANCDILHEYEQAERTMSELVDKVGKGD